MIDQGGNGNGNGSSGINRFANTAPTVIFSLLQQLQSLGLSFPDVLAQLGIEQKDGKLSLAASQDEKTIPSDEKADAPIIKDNGDRKSVEKISDNH